MISSRLCYHLSIIFSVLTFSSIFILFFIFWFYSWKFHTHYLQVNFDWHFNLNSLAKYKRTLNYLTQLFFQQYAFIIILKCILQLWRKSHHSSFSVRLIMTKPSSFSQLMSKIVKKKQSDNLKIKQQKKYQQKNTLFLKVYEYSIHCNALIYMIICLKDSD